MLRPQMSLTPLLAIVTSECLLKYTCSSISSKLYYNNHKIKVQDREMTLNPKEAWDTSSHPLRSLFCPTCKAVLLLENCKP